MDYHLNPNKINKFYEKLVTHVEALDNIGKLKEYIRLTLNKLLSIKSDLVRIVDGWHDWDFEELTKELSKWVDRNPVSQTQSMIKGENSSCKQNEGTENPVYTAT